MENSKNKQKIIIIALVVFILLLLSMCLAAMMSKYNDSVDPEDYDTDPPAVREEDFSDDVSPTSTIVVTPTPIVTPTEMEQTKFTSEDLGVSIEEMEGWVISEEFPEPIKTRLENNRDFLPPCELAIFSSNGNTILFLDISNGTDGGHCFSANEIFEGYKSTFSPFNNMVIFDVSLILQLVENQDEIEQLKLIVESIKEL